MWRSGSCGEAKHAYYNNLQIRGNRQSLRKSHVTGIVVGWKGWSFFGEIAAQSSRKTASLSANGEIPGDSSVRLP
jgi:hypothetical protein